MTLRKVVRKVAGSLGLKPEFTTSSDYWEERYRKGGNSGAGSYNRLAEFKAEFLNDYVKKNGIRTVIEFGSGDGAQLLLADYPEYVGVDVSRTVLEEANRKFADAPNISFIHTSEVTDRHKADLSLSLDVIYHLVEDTTFDAYMKQLFNAADKAAIVYASNEDRAWDNQHVRHRQFTRWVDQNRSDFVLKEQVKNKYPYDEQDIDNTSFADFFVYEKVRSAAG